MLWIARNKNGDLYLHDARPCKDSETFHCFGPYSKNIYLWDENLFPEVTFENSPRKVELKLVEE